MGDESEVNAWCWAIARHLWPGIRPQGDAESNEPGTGGFERARPEIDLPLSDEEDYPTFCHADDLLRALLDLCLAEWPEWERAIDATMAPAPVAGLRRRGMSTHVEGWVGDRDVNGVIGQRRETLRAERVAEVQVDHWPPDTTQARSSSSASSSSARC